MSQKFLSTVALTGITGGSVLKVNASGEIVAAVAGTDYVSSATSSQWTTSGSNIYFTGGDVGIGTTNPATRLHVVSSNDHLQFYSGVATSYISLAVGRTANEGFYGVAGAANHFFSGSIAGDTILKSANNLILGHSSNAAIFISTGDKVGIKNLTPNEALDVTGTIRQSAVTSSMLKTDANGNLVAATTGTDYYSTAAEVLSAISGVDGSGSGLDADTVDGKHSSYFALGSTYQSFGTADRGWLMPDYGGNTSNFLRMYYEDGTYELRLYSYHGTTTGPANLSLYNGSAYVTVTPTKIGNWDTAFGWGDHYGLYSLTTHNHDSTYLKLSGGSISTANTAIPLTIARTSATSNQVGVLFSAGAFEQVPTNRYFGMGTDGEPYWSSSSNLTTGNEIWHAGNDGTGSGLDADLLDGYHASSFSLTTHNHDSTYLPLSGGTITGDLIVDGAFTINDGVEKTQWGRSYSVSNTVIEELLTNDGNALATGGAYRVVGHIDGTGTDQASTAVFWNENGTWYVNVTGQSGTSSNHIQFLVYGGVPSLKTYHANNYTVRVYHERIGLQESTGTDNARFYYGADSYMSDIAGILKFEGSHTVWHSGNDGASSGLDADLLDGNHASAFALSAHTHTAATTDADGFMSSADKSKLDGIEASANNYSLPAGTSTTRGGFKIGYTASGKNYPVEVSNEQMYVTVPWTDTDTVYTLPLSSSTTRGGVKIGYTENSKNYAVKLSSEQMYVTVPWTDTTYATATSTTAGLVKIGYTENGKNYPVELSSEQMYVNVPWTDTTYGYADAETDGIISGSDWDKFYTAFSWGDHDGLYLPIRGGTISKTSTHVTQGSISASNAHIDLYNDWESNTDQKGSIITFTDNYFDGTNYIKTTRAAIKGGTDTVGNTADGYLEFYVDSAGANSPDLAIRIDRNKNVTFNGGINGFTNSAGISGNNFNITGVNQLEINDPGEGIVFKSGSSGDITLAIVDDASDNILRLSGTGATMQIGTEYVATKNWVEAQGYITSETDSQTLSWSGSEKKITISNGNDITLSDLLNDSDISNYGFITSVTTPVSGSWWNNGHPKVLTDGVMEIGKYVDWHYTSAATTDYDYRMYLSAATTMSFSGNATFNGGVTVGDSSSDVFKSNGTTYLAALGNSVGVGTTSPNHKVDIYSNENVPLRIHRPSNANLDSSGAWGIGFSTRSDANNSTTDTRAGIFSYYNGNLFLAAANTSIVADPDAYARLTVLNTGNVGIGTTSPSERLHVIGNIDTRTNNSVADTNKLLFNPYNGPADGGGTTIGTGITWKPLYSSYSKRSAGIMQIAEGNYFRAGLAFYTNGVQDISTDWSERLRISSNGNVGIGTTSPTEKLDVNGNVRVNGTLEATEKSFNIAHPTKEGKRLIYGVLEGPEHAVYVRGKASNGVIELPEEWTGLVHEDSLTVQLTPIGRSCAWVEEIKDNKVYFGIDHGHECFYFVQGTRKDVDFLQTERDA